MGVLSKLIKLEKNPRMKRTQGFAIKIIATPFVLYEFGVWIII